MKNKIFLLIPIFILIAGSFLYFKYQKNPSEVTVRLKWKHNAQFAGIYSSIENGTYEKSGIKVKLLERDFSKGSVADEVASGKVNFGIADLFDLAQAVDKGKKVKAVGVVFQYSPSAIISLKESNITSPADLAGKKLGVVNNSPNNRLFYESLLNKYGISMDSVEFVETKNNSLDKLIKKEVDTVSVYRTNEPYQLKKLGIDYYLIRPEYQDIHTYDDLIITSEDMIKNHPDKVKAFVKGTAQGWKTAITDENNSLKIISKYDSGFYDLDRERFIFRKSTPLISWEGFSNIGKMDDEVWKNTIEFLYVNKIIKSKYETSKIYTNKFIY